MTGRCEIRAARGTERTAKSWPTEAALRMLHNNLDPEVAEHPDELVVYGGTGKAARDWRSFDAICARSTDLDEDETLLVQSGQPVGVLRTHEWAPRVLIANSNLVRRLGELAGVPAAGGHSGLTMYGQMTAGSWIYIGTQGILQGTYETFAAVAEKRFGGTLAGTLTLTAGLGGMGGAQPLAVTMNGGVALVVECDPTRIAAPARSTGYLDVVGGRPSTTRSWQAEDARAERQAALDRRCSAMPPRCCPTCSRRGADVDIVTDQTSAHDPLAYLPSGRRPGRLAALRARRPATAHRRAAGVDGRARRGDGRLPGRRRRGLRLRQLDPGRGPAGRIRAGLRLPGLRARLHPPAVLRGQGAVPVGRAVRRPRRHPRHRRGRARRCSRTTTTVTAGCGWPGRR